MQNETPLPVNSPDMIKLAVEAAGGRSQVAQALGVDVWTVTNWQRSRRVPPAHIRRLCTMGANVITADQLLAYMEQHTTKAAA